MHALGRGHHGDYPHLRGENAALELSAMYLLLTTPTQDEVLHPCVGKTRLFWMDAVAVTDYPHSGRSPTSLRGENDNPDLLVVLVD